MANLDDLGFLSITDKSTIDNLETLRQIRLARRTPTRQAKSPTKPSTKKTKEPEVSAEQAARLLALLENSDD
jgi:hypothetical protein